MSDNRAKADMETQDPADSTKDDSTAEVDKSNTEDRSEEKNTNDTEDSAGSEDENEESKEEKKEALFEAPIVVEGKRERKKTERLSIAAATEKKVAVIPEGNGVKLEDIPYTAAILRKQKSEDLNLLHRALFNISGDHASRKPNIRQFCGFTFEKGSSEYEKRMEFLSRVFKDLLVTQFTSVLGLKSSLKKEELVQSIMDFLMKPYDTGAKPPGTKKKAKSTAKKKDQKSPDKKKKSPKKKPKKKEGSETVEDSDSSGDESDGDSASEKKPSSKKENGDGKEKKKDKAKKTPAKKSATPKKEKEKKDAKKKAATKSKTPKKTQKTPKKELSSLSESESDDEPLVKKIKLRVPGDDEIRDLVSKILDSSSLEDLSIRKVFQQVQEKYPGIDLSDKQKFVKATVKELIN